MTELYIFVWITILLLITQPGMAAALALLLPNITERAALRLEHTPVISFGVGFVIAGFTSGLAVILANVLAPAAGGIIAVLGLGFYALGAAGMSRLFGSRLPFARKNPLRDTLIGATLLELACFLPLVGWFLFFPLVLALNTGAAAFAIIGWAPRDKPAPQAQAQQVVWSET